MDLDELQFHKLLCHQQFGNLNSQTKSVFQIVTPHQGTFYSKGEWNLHGEFPQVQTFQKTSALDDSASDILLQLDIQWLHWGNIFCAQGYRGLLTVKGRNSVLINLEKEEIKKNCNTLHIGEKFQVHQDVGLFTQ